ncbi:SWI/SNF-related matrix-associated actin-dependent regulator of chromatin subfamily A containing DEAD/H box 1A-like, partial [Sinocyclocheilus grahami]|uniref:SWI/SNF-related matrix-associated actin-dependent regulator of chromatin subfamily A containing DEAD/H box 1A-like n=1 Tax=Sinocyclocheilus grahami TaxID=75366 RepID=UPI0007AC63BF
VLRDVLREHDWDYENALGSLLVFSSTDSCSPEDQRKQKLKSSHSREKKDKSSQKPDSSSSLSRWLTAVPSPVPKVSSVSTPKTQKSAVSKSMTKNTSFKRKRGDESPLNDVSASEDEEEIDSDVESISDNLDSEDEDSISGNLQDKIIQFLQEASLDELALISGCSIKKAQKIISLRPFKTWKDVVRIECVDSALPYRFRFQRDNAADSHSQSSDGSNSDKENKRDTTSESKNQISKDMEDKIIKLMELFPQKSKKDLLEVVESTSTLEGAIAHCLGINGDDDSGRRKGKAGHSEDDDNDQPKKRRKSKVLNSNFKLQPYQLIGLKWLILLHQHNLSGILADEMGLGKTIQAISFLAHLYEKGIKGPHLITVPSSTLDNWVRELGLWCPSLKVLIYYGSVEDRKYLRQDILSGLVEFNIIVSTYNLTIGNYYDRSLFRKLRLKYAVFDEGHMLKNMNSLRYHHLMAINAEHRLLLTGTPLQNNLLELMSLLNFIMPSMFSSSTSQISKMFSTRSSEEESRFHKDRIAQAKLIMKPFILRRVKSEVLKQLPPKVQNIEMCPMSDAQQKLYDKLFKRLQKAPNGDKRELCNVMMQLRKMANHPLLHRQYYTSDKLTAMSKAMLKEPTHFDADPVLIQEDMEVMSDFELHNLCKQYSSIRCFELEKELLLDSGKFALLTKVLARLKEKGDRVVLFSQFTMMLDIVEILLKHLDHQFVRLDGSTPMAERIGLIDKYNTNREIFVFLLSTRAGGQGINLASANTVILHDIDCNPFNDKQAEDRCHRMGQTRTVQVIKLISRDSIEACMLRVGQEKLKLEQDMTTDGEEDSAITEQMAELLKVSLGL